MYSTAATAANALQANNPYEYLNLNSMSPSIPNNSSQHRVGQQPVPASTMAAAAAAANAAALNSFANLANREVQAAGQVQAISTPATYQPTHAQMLVTHNHEKEEQHLRRSQNQTATRWEQHGRSANTNLGLGMSRSRGISESLERSSAIGGGISGLEQKYENIYGRTNDSTIINTPLPLGTPVRSTADARPTEYGYLGRDTNDHNTLGFDHMFSPESTLDPMSRVSGADAGGNTINTINGSRELLDFLGKASIHPSVDMISGTNTGSTRNHSTIMKSGRGISEDFNTTHRSAELPDGSDFFLSEQNSTDNRPTNLSLSPNPFEQPSNASENIDFASNIKSVGEKEQANEFHDISNIFQDESFFETPLNKNGLNYLQEAENDFKITVEVKTLPIYGERASTRKKANSKRKRKTSHGQNRTFPAPCYLQTANPPPVSSLEGPSHLVASHLPSSFPPELAYRALAVYSILRTLSFPLQLSPFTPLAFLRSLSLPCYSELSGAIHVSVLRFLYDHYDLGTYSKFGDGMSKLKLPCMNADDGVSDYLARKETLHSNAGKNLVLMDNLTWPLFFRDYVQINRMNDSEDTVTIDPEFLGGNEIQMQQYFNSAPGEFDGSDYDAEVDKFEVELMQWQVLQQRKKQALSAMESTRKNNKRQRNRHTNKKSRRLTFKRGESSDEYSCESVSDEDEEYVVKTFTSSSKKRRRPMIASSSKKISVKQQGVDETSGAASSAPHSFDIQSSQSRLIRQSQYDAIGIYIRKDEMEKMSQFESNSVPTSTFPVDNVSGSTFKETDNQSSDHGVNQGDETSFPQIHPLEGVNSSSSYLSLDIPAKVQILEYLVDELLETELVSTQMSKRKEISKGYPGLYGVRSDVENGTLVNNDECSICNSGGELLCCDWCPSSYHPKCVNISTHQNLGDEKWKCPDCEIIDCAKFGPLHGNLKCSLDWFRLDNIQAFKPKEHIESSEQIFTENNVESRQMKPPNKALLTVEFLIIHGFVFVRDFDKRPVKLSALLSLDNTVHKSSSTHLVNLVPLNTHELYSLLSSLGPDLGNNWPWIQIPFNPNKIWKHSQGQPSNSQDPSFGTNFTLCGENHKAYFAKNESFNPLLYSNAYSCSSNHESIRANIDSALPHKPCIMVDVSKFRDEISWDCSNDDNLGLLLRVNKNLHNPMNAMQVHCIHLERSLHRSMLLHELWGLRNKSLDDTWWSRKVVKCKTIRDLAKLLVYLIDHTHPRAFCEEWTFMPGVVVGGSSPTNGTSRTYNSLPANWTIENEVQKRKWERCGKSDILSLLVKEFGSSNRVFGKVSTRKGKKKVYLSEECRGHSKMNDVEANMDITANLASNNWKDENFTSIKNQSRKHNRRGTHEENRRRSDRHQVQGLNETLHKIATGTGNEISDKDLIRLKKFHLENILNEPFEKEPHWPLGEQQINKMIFSLL